MQKKEIYGMFSFKSSAVATGLQVISLTFVGATIIVVGVGQACMETS